MKRIWFSLTCSMAFSALIGSYPLSVIKINIQIFEILFVFSFELIPTTYQWKVLVCNCFCNLIARIWALRLQTWSSRYHSMNIYVHKNSYRHYLLVKRDRLNRANDVRDRHILAIREIEKFSRLISLTSFAFLLSHESQVLFNEERCKSWSKT